MNYKELITRYSDSETKYPLKAERNKKLDELLRDLHIGKSNFTLQEIEEVITKLLSKKLTIRMPLFAQILYPVISQGIKNKEVKAIKLFLSLIQQVYQYQNFTKEHIYDSNSLIQQGLQIDPSDKELLTLQESNIRSYLLYTLHELPIGVLYGQNGASIQECSELLEYLVEYRQLCNKLQLDNSDLINKCKFYYSSYKYYLTNRPLYTDFNDYLAKHSRKGE
ncbi:hypothetical protein HHL22_05980 [Hymenobacter sp. RP-2-7]|uniref:Uncharacterized protein n=1 Tax=Hymenobacter polaris TaxID=2682546 RepID=A0A7Y0ACC7_9BACT|nr:hypothetical protein [Hymenobacter polaris]NML64751.1 hypothetical protein [Hymenobacter polaris]